MLDVGVLFGIVLDVDDVRIMFDHVIVDGHDPKSLQPPDQHVTHMKLDPSLFNQVSETLRLVKTRQDPGLHVVAHIFSFRQFLEPDQSLLFKRRQRQFGHILLSQT